jgi:hypothetical protein
MDFIDLKVCYISREELTEPVINHLQEYSYELLDGDFIIKENPLRESSKRYLLDEDLLNDYDISILEEISDKFKNGYNMIIVFNY